MKNADKQSAREQRLTAILRGAFSGPPTPPKDIPTKDIPKKKGESRVVPDRPITTAADQVHAAAEALRNVAKGGASAHDPPPPPKKHPKRDKKSN